MTLHIHLSAEMAAYVTDKVASGLYGNATEVICDAIQRMQAQENRLQAWEVAVKKGEDQLDANESMPYNAAMLDDVTRMAKADASCPVDPDVLG